MTLRAEALIPEPCPVAWDEMTGYGTQRFCARCSKSVHDLSGLTESELQRVVARGESMCVQLVVDRNGAIVFSTPPVVPASRLRASAIAATTLATLVACTPHVLPNEPTPEPEAVLPGLSHVPHAHPEPPPPPRETYRMGGAILGPHSAIPQRHQPGPDAVPCDTLAKSSHGRPTDLEGRRTLLDEVVVARADLLARCEP